MNPPIASVLVADPPWRFGDGLPGAKRGASSHYSTMTISEIQRCALPSFTDDAALFLWRVSSMVEEAYDVCRAWGFSPKSEIVWIKTSPGTGRPAMGMGRIVRGAHETCIVATRGRPVVRDRGVRTVFASPRADHSRKPERFFEIVEKLFAGPYVEIFARTSRPGWVCLGDEAPT